MQADQELQSAVSQLSEKELARFREWFDKFDAKAWDKQFEEDVKSGKLDQLATKQLQIFVQGSAKNYEPFCKPFVLGVLSKTSTRGSKGGGREFHTAEEESETPILAFEEGRQVMVCKSRNLTPNCGSRS